MLTSLAAFGIQQARQANVEIKANEKRQREGAPSGKYFYRGYFF